MNSGVAEVHHDLRQLIVCTGRSGSSFLSKLMAAAGADFATGPGIDAPLLPAGVAGANDPALAWKYGNYEHLGLHEAYKWYARSEKITRSLIPAQPWKRIFEKKMLAAIEATLSRAHFAKTPDLVWLVQPIFRRCRYHPSIIISYRHPNAYASSRYIKDGWSYPKLMETYCAVYATALQQLYLFGGCTVSYEEMTDPGRSGWAEALAQVTGLEAGRLLAARSELTRSRSQEHEALISDPPSERVFAQLQRLEGQVVEGSLPLSMDRRRNRKSA